MLNGMPGPALLHVSDFSTLYVLAHQICCGRVEGVHERIANLSCHEQAILWSLVFFGSPRINVRAQMPSKEVAPEPIRAIRYSVKV